MAAKGPSGSDFGAHARHCLGVCPLLCRHHGCELDLPFYHTHRFLNRDHIMFDCGSMAFSEAGFLTSSARVRPLKKIYCGRVAHSALESTSRRPLLRMGPST